MDKLNKDLEQDNSVDRELQEMFGFSEEALLEEFENAGKDNSPLPIPDPPSDEFDRIWARIQEERSDSNTLTMHSGKVIKPRFRWKRLAAVGLIACLIAGSGCFVAMGTKSYFYRRRVGDTIKNNLAFDNDSNKAEVNDEEEAYVLIEQSGIRPLKLGHIPSDMRFSSLEIKEGYSVIEFTYKGDFIYFIQTKFDKKASYDYKSDAQLIKSLKIKNKWIGKELTINKENLTNGKQSYEMMIVVDGTVYRLFGTMEEDSFIDIVKDLTF
ncbi:MAG: DUF4367 domain-containing protein [Enterocloster sp.]